MRDSKRGILLLIYYHENSSDQHSKRTPQSQAGRVVAAGHAVAAQQTMAVQF
jgi:hypothetical protein